MNNVNCNVLVSDPGRGAPENLPECS